MFGSVRTGKKRFVTLLGSVAMMVVLAVAVIGPPMALAQATRTWVSGVGDDANPCARTAPCKTFAGAISKTAAGGEINCIDPGGFGGVTITKALTISCEYTEGGILSAGAGVNGVVVNAGVNDVVTLRGLDINGAGNAQNGVRFIAGAALHIEQTLIRNYKASNATGVNFAPTGASELFISDSVISNNGTASTGGGLLIKPSTGGSANVTLKRVALVNNENGLFADGTTSTGGIKLTVVDCDASGNTLHGFSVGAGANPVQVMIDSSSSTYNGASGVLANGTGAKIRIGRSTITGNAIGTNQVTANTIESFQTNHILGNTNDGTRVPIAQN